MTTAAPTPYDRADALPPWSKRALTDLLRQRGHAWLLEGPSGMGQHALALALARAWLCERPSADAACGSCDSCHAVDVHTHADLCVLMPEATLIDKGWPIDEKAQSDIDDKKRKPSREIRVEAMREAIGFAQRTSARGRGKVVLVYPAERMNTITANALLKTLEEPAGDLRFVLATEAGWQLLPTIRSRCQAHAMRWPASDEARAWLAGQGATGPDADVALQAAGGRPDDALDLLREGLTPNTWAALPRAMARGESPALTTLSGGSPARAIASLQKLCHDLMALSSGGALRYFAVENLPPPPSMQALARWSRSLLQAARTAQHPFNAGLMLEALTSEAREAIASGRPDGKRP